MSCDSLAILIPKFTMKSNRLVVYCVALLYLQYVRSEITSDNADPVNYCEKICGTDPGTKCDDPYKEKELKDCGCRDWWKNFIPSSKRCQRQCNDGFEPTACKNGGKCIDTGEYKYCECVEGTTGEYCEIITERINYCEKVCGTDPRTTCDDPYKEKELKDCGCLDSFKNFIPSTKRCQRQCNKIWPTPCLNGGQCVDTGKYKYCACVEGTTGEYCAIIPECSKSLKSCKYGRGSCVFEEGKATCKCAIASTKFYEKGGYCDDECDDDSDCKYGKFCNEDDFCECPEGLDGYDCWDVPGCKELEKFCQEQNAECVYDEYAQNKVTCKCKEKGFTYDPKAKQCKADFCKETCGDVKCEGDALNKTAIVCKCKEEYEDFNEKDKTCKVNKCKKVCGADPEIECDDPDEKLEFEDCTCNTPKFFRPSKIRCQEQCSNISSWTDVHCQNEGVCVSEGDCEFCECSEGTTGDFCENITECEKRFKGCKGDGGKCVFQEGKAKCECSKDNTVFNKKKGYCEGN